MKQIATFSNRLAFLRTQAGLTQEDLAIKISEIENRKKAYSSVAISGWETRDKCPPVYTLVTLCDFFDVSADYLLGRSDDPRNKRIYERLDCRDHKIPGSRVNVNELKKLDGEPVYVEFVDKRAEDKWGVVDICRKRIAFSDSYLHLDRRLNCVFYTSIPESQRVPSYNRRKRLSMRQVLSSDRVWVEMITSDKFIKGRYNGWYRNNEDHSCLINTLGLTLPYKGLSISYNAFSGEL